jgi:hypothetical protein
MSNKDVYKNHITTYFGKNDIINVVEGFTIEDSSLNRIKLKRDADMVDISNNIAKINYNLSEISKNSPKNKEINETVSKNYLKMKAELGRYNMRNFSMMTQPHLYERIDDNGNLYKDLEPSVSDARRTDSKEILLQQNTAYIIGSLIVSSLLIIAVSIQ